MTRPTGNAWYAQQRRELMARSQPRKGLNRIQAAVFIGVSVEVFDGLVQAGIMPQPKIVAGAELWDIDALDLFFTALPDAKARLAGRSPPQ
jgi:hypothetical protein